VVTGPRAVLFDWGGTLDAEGEPWKDRVAALLRAEGLTIPPERFDPAFYGADDALVGAVPPALPFDATVRRLIDGLVEGLALTDRSLAARVAAAFLERSRAAVRANAPLLEALARRYRLGIVSNFYGNLDAVCDDCGVRSLFGIIIDSARVGWQKPDPRIFQAALEGLGVSAAEAVFVGDSLPRDMAGARAVGMPHVWLAGQGSQRRAPCCPTDPVLHSLRELEGLLL
jgi:putative hydrolase of the HAD superfamily